MDDRTLTEMALDDLWALHQRVASILASRLETQKSELEDRLRQLRANAAPNLVKEPSRRRYPAVPPKFRNPAEPHQTWSGRGKRPHWVTELLDAGSSIQDFQISETNGLPSRTNVSTRQKRTCGPKGGTPGLT
jgi:DNA-binding protein H-NS